MTTYWKVIMLRKRKPQRAILSYIVLDFPLTLLFCEFKLPGRLKEIRRDHMDLVPPLWPLDLGEPMRKHSSSLARDSRTCWSTLSCQDHHHTFARSPHRSRCCLWHRCPCCPRTYHECAFLPRPQVVGVGWGGILPKASDLGPRNHKCV